MLAEGELRSNLDDSDRVRDLQDKVADLKAEVIYSVFVVVTVFLERYLASIIKTNCISNINASVRRIFGCEAFFSRHLLIRNRRREHFVGAFD